MAEDRLDRDYDFVENLGDLIEAREERDSAFADDVDAMQDFDYSKLPVDANDQLTYPHPKTRAEEDGQLGLNLELMDTPDKTQVEFDWQDNAEEMLPTDPEPNEGMGADTMMHSIGHVDPNDLIGPVPSTEISPDMDTAATEDERERYRLDGGEPCCPPPGPEPIESAMDTDSDELDFRIEDKFTGEVTREEAEYEFELMRETQEEGETGR